MIRVPKKFGKQEVPPEPRKNLFTRGIYDGRSEGIWVKPIEDLTVEDIGLGIFLEVAENPMEPTDDEWNSALVQLMVYRVKDDIRIYYPDMPDEDRTALIKLAEENALSALEWCIQDVKDTRQFQYEVITSTRERYGDLRTDDEAWKRWKEDHSYDNDTLNHACRELRNGSLWLDK